MLRVAIDGHLLGRAPQGNETYLRGLLLGLVQAAPETQITLLTECDESRVLRAIPACAQALRSGKLEVRTLPHRPAVARLLFQYPLVLGRERFDIVHFQYLGPPWCPVPIVLSIHDVSFWQAPELLPRAQSLRMRLTMDRAVRTAAAILVPSEWTQQALLKRHPEAASRTTVVPLAVSRRYHASPAADDQAVRASLGIDGRYFLYMGRLARRKNLSLLLHAYSRALAASPELPALLLAGGDGGERRRLERIVAQEQLASHVRLLGAVPDRAVPALYRGALALLHPALLEGFGLTALEAMASGVPVLAANHGALKEISRGAAMLLVPDDVAAWSSAILDVSSDTPLRDKLRGEGARVARRATWCHAGELTAEVYRRVAYGV